MIVVVILLLRGDFMLSYKELVVVNKELLVRIRKLKNQLIKERRIDMENKLNIIQQIRKAWNFFKKSFA